MIYLITGTPGAGKSLRGVQYIERFLKEGRLVYTDLDGIKLPGVLPAPDDWRETPDGSVVVYDECQRRFPADGSRGRSERQDIAALETHRHTGHDLVLITQHPNLIHSHVRRLVGRHEHLMRLFGYNRARVYWRDRAWQVDQRGERESAAQEEFAFPKRLFDQYTSASLHTTHKRIPGKVKMFAAAIFCCLVLLAWLSPGAMRFFRGDSTSAAIASSTGRSPSVPASSSSAGASVPAAVVSASLPYDARDWAAVPVAATVAGCVWSADYCRCYSHGGDPLLIGPDECHRRVARPLPVNVHAVARRPSPAPVQPEATSDGAGGGADGRSSARQRTRPAAPPSVLPQYRSSSPVSGQSS